MTIAQDHKAQQRAQQRAQELQSIKDAHAQPRTIGPGGTTTIQTPSPGTPIKPAQRGVK